MEIFNSFHGFFLSSQPLWYSIGSAVLVLILGYTGAPLLLWTIGVAAILIGFGAPLPVLYAFGALAAIFNITPLRRVLVSTIMAKVMAPIMPKISATERTALEAGVVWVEKDLFSGKPNFKNILAEPYNDLTPEEQAFMNGPLNELCSVVDDWQVWNDDKDLPPEAWNIMRREKFFGMIIPKEYGGLGFSARASSQVVMTLGTRSIPLCITVMVPNSLGPGELLSHYGTEEQKKHYLPRLADGREVPCFALTEPTAGSDAGSIKANGVLFKDKDGSLKIKLNWDKRYITLAAISTLLGLAFKLKDPDNLLGRGKNLGITCALIPTDTEGVEIGQRHDPLGVPFYNCPTRGKDVVVSAEQIIGGVKNAGLGWQMLMDCLSAGRGISLPAQSTGGSKMFTQVVSAYSSVRNQFGMNIGMFEGIQEPVARIAGLNYMMEAARKYTLGALDSGIKPPVITAMMKLGTTEIMRKSLNDAMDICGGAAISRGRHNLLAHAYIGAPIGITVEGANILTRTLMIFGQGALRAHPYAYQEVASLEKKDIAGFDKAFWGHIGHIVRNSFRSILLSMTRGRLAGSPVGGPVAQYYRKLAWTSASFAIMSDIAMGALGGTLKARQMITGRYADILMWMYFGVSTLRRWEAEGRKKEDLPFVHYSMQRAFGEIQTAFDGIFANLGVKGFGWLFGGIIRIWSKLNSLGNGPSDKVSQQVAFSITNNLELRKRMIEGVYQPTDPSEGLSRLENAFLAVKRAEKIFGKIRKAIKSKQLPKIKGAAIVEKALEAKVITAEEAKQLQEAEKLRNIAIQVNEFSQAEYTGKADAQPGDLMKKAG